MPKKPNPFFRFFAASILIMLSLLFANCSGQPPNGTLLITATVTPRQGELTPFFWSTATRVQFSTPAATTTTPFPSVTPTPRTHIVKKGEDLSGIALRYHVQLADLLAANPKVNPNMMSVGTVLIIPGDAPQLAAGKTSDVQSTPTAIPIKTDPLHCFPDSAGGVWCAMLVQNSQNHALESLTAVFRLLDPQTRSVQEQGAFLPLDVLHPGQSLPLTAYFPPPVPLNFEASAEIRSALPSIDNGRYLPIRLEQQQITLDENQLSAKVSLQVFVEGTSTPPKRLWITATAYDQSGRVIGMRRWEKPADLVLTPKEAFPVSMFVYSNNGEIARVDVAGEARP